MTRDDIICIAREAGIGIAGPMDTIDPRNVYAHELERFAALVAAAERERCCKIVYGMAGSDNVAQRTVEKIQE